MPDDIGQRYLSALDAYQPTLRAEVEGRFTNRHDSRKEGAFKDALSRLYARVASFLAALCQYEAAAAMQRIALSMDHEQFDNMSARVAGRTRELAQTIYLQGKFGEAMKLLSLSLGVYSSLIPTDGDGARLEYVHAPIPEPRAPLSHQTPPLGVPRVSGMHARSWSLRQSLATPKTHRRRGCSATRHSSPSVSS